MIFIDVIIFIVVVVNNVNATIVIIIIIVITIIIVDVVIIDSMEIRTIIAKSKLTTTLITFLCAAKLREGRKESLP